MLKIINLLPLMVRNWTLIAISFFVLFSCAGLKDIRYSRKGQSINLSRKGLTQIPEEVFEHPDLRVLRLYGNALDSLPERIGNLDSLEKLFVGRNKLTELPKSLSKLTNLKVLSIQYNDLEELPSNIGDLENLQQLILNQNYLKTLPASIGDLNNLERLELDFNSLTSIPDEIGNCENLRFLHLNRNNLQKLPASIGGLRRLKELHVVQAGPLLELPDTLCDMRNLEILEVDPVIVVPTCLFVLQANRLQIIVR